MNHNNKPQSEEVKNTILDALITASEAQARALRLLRKSPAARQSRRRVGTSQVDLVEDILARAGGPLHINEIMAQVEKIHGLKLDRESIVSALTKKVMRNERFVRTPKNTFDLKGRRD
jgi:hypothetical protein